MNIPGEYTSETSNRRRGKTFEEWMEAVSDAVEVICGFSLEDLPDCDLWNWWDEETTPVKAANMAISEAGGI